MKQILPKDNKGLYIFIIEVIKSELKRVYEKFKNRVI